VSTRLRKLKIICVLTLLGSIVLIVYLLDPFLLRFEILSDYSKLLSDPDALKRLEADVPVKALGHVQSDQPFSIGYASFDIPFGDVLTISREYHRIYVNTLNEKVNIPFPLYQDAFADEHVEDAMKNLPSFTLKGGDLAESDKKFSKYELSIAQWAWDTPNFEQKQYIFNLKPEPLLKLLFMDFEQLYFYEKLIETKNAELAYDPFLFQTETVDGMVERHVSAKSGINYYILLYDKHDKIYQLIAIHPIWEDIPQGKLVEFISSFSFTPGRMEKKPDNLEAIVDESLQQYDCYLPVSETETGIN